MQSQLYHSMCHLHLPAPINKPEGVFSSYLQECGKGDKIRPYETAGRKYRSQRVVPSKYLQKELPGYISSQKTADSDSLSTLDSFDDNPDSTLSGTGRSIFRDYWDTDSDEKEVTSSYRHILSGGTPDHESSSSQHRSLVPRSISLDWSSYQQDYESVLTDKVPCDPHGYEDNLKVNEEGRTVLPSAAPLNVAKNSSVDHLMTRNPLASPSDTIIRREIFPEKYISTSTTLPSYEYKSKLTPSTLYHRRTLRSSLRDRNSSVSESLPTVADSISSQSTRLSVTFDTRVSIHEFSKPCESYIDDGWSKYFS